MRIEPENEAAVHTHAARLQGINDAPTVSDYSGIRRDVTDLNQILNNIDTVEGRNDYLREYIYALRDLQHAHNRSVFAGEDGEGGSNDDIDRAYDAVNEAFGRLVIAQLTLSAHDSIIPLCVVSSLLQMILKVSQGVRRRTS